MSSYFKIRGKNPIQGEFFPQGNKNEALPVLCALCLIKGEITIYNLPQIHDIQVLLKILGSLGIKITQLEKNTFHFNNSGDLSSELDLELTSQIRGSVTLAGPVLAKTGKIVLPRPGGDKIGRRRIDTHLLGLELLGSTIEVFNDRYIFTAKELKGIDILLDETSVTATENIVMAACLAKGKTIIHNAASEPHVQNLCNFLNLCGAEITGIGTNVLEITGVEKLIPKVQSYRIGSDYLEIGSIISLAAITNGEVVVKDSNFNDLRMIQMVYQKLGINFTIEKNQVVVKKNQKLEIIPDYHGLVPKIDDSPWPGFPADMISVALVTATQCKGTMLFHEKMFESRLFFVDHIIGMGANIILCDPHRAVISGPNQLYGKKVASPDIRAGMAMLIAALCAEGESEIHNIIQIDRGFENIDKRLVPLGASISRINE